MTDAPFRPGRVLAAAGVVAFVATWMIVCYLTDSSPWSIVVDLFLAFERFMLRSA